MTDREGVCKVANESVGKDEAWVRGHWNNITSGWDGAWCTETFIVFCYLAGQGSKVPLSNYAADLSSKFKAQGRFGTEPQLGSAIFFDYHDGEGISHTGTLVGWEDGKAYTVEGNVGGHIVARNYPQNSSYIAGYGYPAYDDYEPEPQPQPTPVPVDVIAESIKLWQTAAKTDGVYSGDIDGIWGPCCEATAQRITLYRDCNYPNMNNWLMQYLLNNNYGPLDLDGWFGPACEDALRRFQKDHGISETGNADYSFYHYALTV